MSDIPFLHKKAIQRILDGVDDLDADEGVKDQFRRLVREIGVHHQIGGIVRNDRV